MNEQELERFAAELRQLPPASLPTDIMARLRAAKPDFTTARTIPMAPVAGWPVWNVVLRWLAPTLALATAMIFMVRGNIPLSVAAKPTAVAEIPAGLKADDVQVDQELVSSFDVVAKLPGGEPVRFRCREMKDEWVVTDQRRGVEIKESRPRIEVTPVRFETY